ncbi:MAG: outer membrane lipoprotein carrier protein LolA, partial [Polyangiales bacterium]
MTFKGIVSSAWPVWLRNGLCGVGFQVGLMGLLGLPVQGQEGEGAKPAPPAAAPAADQAGPTLASVQSFYDQTRDISADFTQTYVNKLYDKTVRSQGHVAFKKPGKMRWDYAKPNGKVIVANSGKLTVFEPGEEPSDRGQVFEQTFGQTDLTQAMSFLLGTGKLVDDFDAKL